MNASYWNSALLDHVSRSTHCNGFPQSPYHLLRATHAVMRHLELVASMRESARILASRRRQQEAFRGVVDADRRTKIQVQRAIHSRGPQSATGW